MLITHIYSSTTPCAVTNCLPSSIVRIYGCVVRTNVNICLHLRALFYVLFSVLCRYVGFSSGVSRKSVVNPYHVSYAPVSAQDSELQSLSSDAPTDDTATSHTTDSSSAYVSLYSTQTCLLTD